MPVTLATGALLKQQRDARAEETRVLCEQVALRLADFVRARFLALEIVRIEADDPAFVADERFDSLAAATEAQYGGFQAINWVDAAGVIRRVVPREPNLAALDHALLEHPPTKLVLADALRSGQPRATAPIALLQGGLGFATYFPVFRGSRLVGAINGVFRIDDLIEGCLSPALRARYQVVIHDGERAVYGDVVALGGDVAAARRFPLLDREWMLRLAPRTAAVSPQAALYSFVASGVALALALAFVAFLAARRQQARLTAEREQRRFELQLARAQRLEGLGRLAGGIAHDFNNLLTVILAASDNALQRGGDLPPSVREGLEDALTAAERAAALTRQLLAFAREQPRVAGRLDLGEAVRATERMLRRLVREDVELAVHCPDEAVWIVSDSAQLAQIVVNLVLNASDALAGPGHVDVTLEVRDSAGAREPAGQWAVLEVKDDGPGISREHLEHIYEPFYTTKGASGGTGLGLATVYGLLQQHDGHLIVETAVGAGAAFRAFFPLAPDGEAPVAAGVETAQTTPAGVGLLVLVVEDEALLRNTARRALTAVGCRVVEATDGADALRKFNDALEPDVVISDVVMPRMGGLELLRELRARGLDVPVILVSGHVDIEINSEELRKLGARFMPKPYAEADIAAAVASAVRARPGRIPRG